MSDAATSGIEAFGSPASADGFQRPLQDCGGGEFIDLAAFFRVHRLRSSHLDCTPGPVCRNDLGNMDDDCLIFICQYH